MKIVLEGNVGSGKTTLAERLAKLYGFYLLTEPVDKNSNPYLEKFYQDKRRWALEMQFWLMAKRFMQDEEAFWHLVKTGQGTIQDRSMRGDKVFAWVNYQLGNIDELGYYSYKNLHEAMARRLPPCNLVIYLDVRPEVCLERLYRRDRKCETAIDKREFLDYLHRLDDGYRRELDAMEAESIKVVRVPWNDTDDIRLISNVLERDERFGSFWRGWNEHVRS